MMKRAFAHLAMNKTPTVAHCVWLPAPRGGRAWLGAALRSVVREVVQRSSAIAALRLVRFADQRLRAARRCGAASI